MSGSNDNDRAACMARNRPSPLGRTKRKLHKPIGTCEGHFRSVEASDCRQFGL